MEQELPHQKHHDESWCWPNTLISEAIP